MKILAKAIIPTRYGEYQVSSFGRDEDDPLPHLALVKDLTSADEVLVRIHSECLTGDLLGSARCDCGDQFDQALKQISTEGGVLIYLRQEGRGIGLTKKLQAYSLQDEGLNTIEANLHLGHAADERSYETAVQILDLLGVSSIRLLTNNPDKINAIEKSEINLLERIPLITTPTSENNEYLETKRKEMGHLLGSNENTT